MLRIPRAIVVAALLCPAVAFADWPVFRGNATMTGVAPPNPPIECIDAPSWVLACPVFGRQKT